MALLQDGTVRSATAQAATDVSVAIMSTHDFRKLCEVYPTFKERIMDVADKRKKQNKVIIHKINDIVNTTRKSLIIDQTNFSQAIKKA